MQRVSGTVVKTGAIALALALAGCGGGGGGEGGSAGAPAAGAPVAGTAQRTVQGTAAKGLIKGANVSLYAIDAQGVRAGTALGTATTAADGTYKLQIPATVQNFVIEVTAAPGATMADEATGTDIALPADMKLRSVVTLAANASGTYEGTVSPLTEMVVRSAETLDGKLPQQAVAQAKANVRTLLGFDPETVKPVNSNSDAAAGASEDEKNQSLALAAISQMASTVTADCAQGVPGERISCVVKKLASSVKVEDGQPKIEQNRLAAFRDALKAVAEDKKINRTGKDKVVGIPVLNLPGTGPAPTVPTPAPIPTPNVPAATPLAATKALFSSLRTNLQALDQGNALRKTADGIKADLDADLLPLSNDAGGFAALTVNALGQLDRYLAGETTQEVFQVWNNQLSPGQVFKLYDVPAGSGICTIAPASRSMTCEIIHIDATVHEWLASGTYRRTYMTRKVTFAPHDGVEGFAYTVGFAKGSVAYDRSGIATQSASTDIPGAYPGVITFRRTGNAVSALSMQGRMPGRLDEAGFVRSGSEIWSLNATRTEEGNGVALYKFGGTFTANAMSTPTQRGQVTGQVEIDHASFLRLAMNDGGDKVVPNAANELQVTLRGTLGTTTVDGTLRVSGDKQDKSKTARMPTKLSFDGSLKHDDATVFTGKVAVVRNGFENFDATAAESATNFVADTVEIGGSLSVPKRPVLSLTLGATRTGIDSVDISAQYRDGTSVINASVSAKAGERNPVVKLSSADGVAFSFTPTSRLVPVTKDGAVTAELDLNKGIITYTDGVTESVK